jgi:hypothetical protein
VLISGSLACNAQASVAAQQNPAQASQTTPNGTPVRVPLALTDAQLADLTVLTPYSGWPVQVRQVAVQEVVSDGVFWVGPSSAERILITTTDQVVADQAAQATADQAVTVYGYFRTPPVDTSTVPSDVDPSVQALVQDQAVYVQAERLEVVDAP